MRNGYQPTHKISELVDISRLILGGLIGFNRRMAHQK
jgi:hypothetical protein